MQELPHQQLGFGILAPDARHVITARFFGMYIGHRTKYKR